MAEKLTADGSVVMWAEPGVNVNREYVWLSRAQALADAMEACKAELDIAKCDAEDYVARADAARFQAESERDEARAELRTAEARNASQRKANARLQAEYDALNAKYETARQNMIRDVAEERAKREAAEALNQELRAEWLAECQTRQETSDAWRKRAEAAEQREARLRAAISRYRRWFDTVTKTQIPDYEERAADALDELDAALVDVPTAPAAEPCQVCNGTKMNATDDGRCRACTPQGPPPRLDLMRACKCPDIPGTSIPDCICHLRTQAQPAPTTLDPALREPLESNSIWLEPICRWVYVDEANAHIAALVAHIDHLQALLSIEQSKFGMAKEIIDGEPQRQKQAVAAKLRDFGGIYRSCALELEAEADELDPPPQQGGTEER